MLHLVCVAFWDVLHSGFMVASIEFQWADERHKISLELRVKTKNLCYPEKMFLTLRVSLQNYWVLASLCESWPNLISAFLIYTTDIIIRYNPGCCNSTLNGLVLINPHIFRRLWKPIKIYGNCEGAYSWGSVTFRPISSRYFPSSVHPSLALWIYRFSHDDMHEPTYYLIPSFSCL